jgi:hypothetical protein
MFHLALPSALKGAAMNHIDTTTGHDQFSGTPFFSQGGRKGIGYDWQSLYAAAEAATLDHEFASIAHAHAE